MAVFRPVWVWPGGYVEITTNAQNRATSALVHVPDGYTGTVQLVTQTGKSFSQTFPTGDTTVPIQPAEAIDQGMTVGMTCQPA